MKFYTEQHPHYCGIDLHTRMMYLCILNQAGAIVLHRNMRADPDSFLKAIAPFRQDIVIAVITGPYRTRRLRLPPRVSGPWGRMRKGRATTIEHGQADSKAVSQTIA